MKLATQIVDALSSDWKPEQYHDTYTEELEGIIAKKDKGKADVVEEAGTDRAPGRCRRPHGRPRGQHLEVGAQGLLAALVQAGHQEGHRVGHDHEAEGPGQEGQLSPRPPAHSERGGTISERPQPSTWTCSWWAPTRTTASVAGSVPGFDHRWRVPFCTTVSPGCEGDHRAVVELEHRGAGEHDLDVQGGGGVHARRAGLHVVEQAREGRVDLGQRRADVDALRQLVVAVRRQREEVEAEAADAREVAGPRLHRAVVRELRRLVEAPQLVERAVRREPRHERRDDVVADEHRLAVGVVPRDHPAHVHLRPPSCFCIRGSLAMPGFSAYRIRGVATGPG